MPIPASVDNNVCQSAIRRAESVFIGVVAFDLLLDTIQQDLLTVDVGSSGYALLINANGDVVVRPNMQANGRWDQPYQTENLLNSTNTDLRAVAGQMVARQSGVQLIQEDGQASYVAYAPITTAGWSVALVIPANEIDAPAIATGQRLSESQSRLWNQLVAVLLMIIIVPIGFPRPLTVVLVHQSDQRSPRGGAGGSGWRSLAAPARGRN
ncbi:MAG: hypothetical protein KatS3mg056_0984 [Chloroflexus sp.]|nr:MAG: hypothetical protein KatS3mg056_0984 [Chloroflexus sp.]